MPQITMSIDDKQVLEMLGRAGRLVGNMKEPLAAAASAAIRIQDKHFLRKMGPAEPWKKVSDQYEKQKRKKGRAPENILRYNGTLMKSISGKGTGGIYRLSETSVVFGTNLVYANIHQFGGVISKSAGTITVRHRLTKSGKLSKQSSNSNLLVFAKKGKSAREQTVAMKAHSIVMPDRPFLYLMPEDIVKIDQIFITWTNKILQGV